jgi:ABC-2 type transport system ATP-binding protein
MIEIRELTKRYGGTTAVDGLSVTIRPGHVTGFLGPNGAGKSTTLRLIIGLNAPTSGSVTVNGCAFRRHARGLRHVGALLDASDVHGGRSGRAHLRVLARSNGLPRSRVEEVLGEVGLTEAAHRRIGTYSLGMKQQLGIAGPCSATRPRCCSTSRSMAWTRRACGGCVACSAGSPPRDARCSCPAT